MNFRYGGLIKKMVQLEQNFPSGNTFGLHSMCIFKLLKNYKYLIYGHAKIHDISIFALAAIEIQRLLIWLNYSRNPLLFRSSLN